MPSIEYAGMKVTGGKVFAILTLLGALGSGPGLPSLFIRII